MIEVATFWVSRNYLFKLVDKNYLSNPPHIFSLCLLWLSTLASCCQHSLFLFDTTQMLFLFFLLLFCFMFYWQTLFTRRMLSSYIFLITLYPPWELKIKTLFQDVPVMRKPVKPLTFTAGHLRQQPQFHLLLLIYQIFYSVETSLFILLK